MLVKKNRISGQNIENWLTPAGNYLVRYLQESKTYLYYVYEADKFEYNKFTAVTVERNVLTQYSRLGKLIRTYRNDSGTCPEWKWEWRRT